MYRRNRNYSFQPPQHVTVIVEDARVQQPPNRVLNHPNRSLITFQNNSSFNRDQEEDVSVEIGMPRKEKRWKNRPYQGTTINHDNSVDVAGAGPSRRREVVAYAEDEESVKPKNKLFDSLRLRKTSAPSATPITRPAFGRKSFDAQKNLDQIIINSKPRPKILAPGAKSVEAKPISAASSRPTPSSFPLPKPTPEADPVGNTCSEAKIKRSLLNPILPPGKFFIDNNLPKEEAASFLPEKIVQRKVEEELPKDIPKIELPKRFGSPTKTALTSHLPSLIKQVLSVEDSGNRVELEEEPEPEEISDTQKEQSTKKPKPTAHFEPSPAKSAPVVISFLPYLNPHSSSGPQEKMRIFPQMETYNPEKMTLSDKEKMHKDIQRERKRRSPQYPSSPPQHRTKPKPIMEEISPERLSTPSSSVNSTSKGSHRSPLAKKSHDSSLSRPKGSHNGHTSRLEPEIKRSRRENYDKDDKYKSSRRTEHNEKESRKRTHGSISARVDHDFKKPYKVDTYLEQDSRKTDKPDSIENETRKASRGNISAKIDNDFKKQPQVKSCIRRESPKREKHDRIEKDAQKTSDRKTSSRIDHDLRKKHKVDSYLHEKSRKQRSDNIENEPAKESHGRPSGRMDQDFKKHPADDVQKDDPRIKEKFENIKNESTSTSQLSPFTEPKAIKAKHGGMMIIPFFTKDYVFSNHFPTPGLIVNGKEFSCTEQYYMWKKAKYTKNESAASAIMTAKDPKEMKLIGINLKPVDESGWKKVSWKYMLEANAAKYGQFEALRFQLFRTMGAKLVEASPSDLWWGCGLSMDSELLSDPFEWQGHNVMGRLLMEIREYFSEKAKYKFEVRQAKKSLIVDER